MLSALVLYLQTIIQFRIVVIRHLAIKDKMAKILLEVTTTVGYELNTIFKRECFLKKQFSTSWRFRQIWFSDGIYNDRGSMVSN